MIPRDLTTFRGLTLWREWAGAIVWHGKRVENRGWAPRDKGFPLPMWVAIHAGTSCQGRTGRAAEIDGRASVRARCALVAGDPAWAPLLGSELVDVCAVSSSIVGIAEVYDVDARERTPWDDPGSLHWRLRHVRRLERPIGCRGSLGLWQLDAQTLQALAEELPRSIALPDGPRRLEAA